MSIENPTSTLENSRNEVDKIIVSEGENLGRIKDVDLAHDLAVSEDISRDMVLDRSPKLTAEEETKSMRILTTAVIAHNVMQRVTEPVTDEERQWEAYDAAKERIDEIQEQVTEK